VGVSKGRTGGYTDGLYEGAVWKVERCQVKPVIFFHLFRESESVQVSWQCQYLCVQINFQVLCHPILYTASGGLPGHE